ncbi:TPA: hypothetical protein O4B07_001126 [Staphylococcus aureus]|nr:hypothetical protein [Staphylococcus aureus]HCZ7682329.1 hypothetical protein [Staphylococcus aureus]HCZ7686940.1 hypothetical protein [Staphylococcus aureus]HCZ7692514.1 hypothetical protein [Staphylococcus aureus]HCZ8010798.1 hypothetical protein [Staphylococcus aureus]
MGGFVNSLIMKDLSDNDMRYKYGYYNREKIRRTNLIK